MLARNADLLVKRNADRIDHRVRQVANYFNCSAIVLKSVVAEMTPVQRINAELESFGYSNFDFFANEDVVPTRAVLPCDRVFELDATRRRRRRFVQKSEM